MNDRRSEPRILLVQHEARHRYALAQTLWEAGMLEAFYTDATAHSPLGCVAALMARFVACPGRMRASLGEKLPVFQPTGFSRLTVFCGPT